MMTESFETYGPEARIRENRAAQVEAVSAARIFDEAYAAPEIQASRTLALPAQSNGRNNILMGDLNTGNIWGNLGIEVNNVQTRTNARSLDPQDTPHRNAEQMRRSENIAIRGVGAQRDTLAHITYDGNGVARHFRDHFGDWRSDDGRTWRMGDVKNEDGPHGIRRGEVRIENGELVFRDSDFGVTTRMDQNRLETRSITSEGGQNFSVTRNERGEPTAFTDSTGTWTRDPEYTRGGRNVWNNVEGNVIYGDVSLTPYGEFRFSEMNQEGRALTPREARSAEIAAVREEQAAMTRDFGVRFALPGRQTIDSDRITFVNGAPSLPDLQALRRVLVQNPQVSFRNVTMFFPAASFEATSHYGQYGPTRDVPSSGRSQAQHGCGSECQSHGNIIRKNNSMIIMPRARMFMEGMHSLEGTLLHELDHLEQGEFHGHGIDAWGVRGQRTPAIEAISNALGWTFSTFRRDATGTPTNSPQDTRAVLRDRQSQYWARVGEDSWRRVEGNLQSNGRLADARFANETRRRTDAEMREAAIVRPATLYFPSPDEMASDASAMYKISANRPGENRRALMFNSPELYRIVQNEDQRRIDTALGVDRETGDSLYIRNLDGMVVRNSPEIRDSIRQQEAIWRAEAESKTEARQRRQLRQTR